MVFTWDLSWGLVRLRGRHPDPHPISLRRSRHVGTLHDLLLMKKPHKYSATVNISSLTNEVIKQPRPHRGWIHFDNRVSEFLVHNKWSARRCDSEESVGLFTSLCVRRVCVQHQTQCVSSQVEVVSGASNSFSPFKWSVWSLSFLLWPVYMELEFVPLGLTNQTLPPSQVLMLS